MSFWVHAWCKASVADVTPSNLSAGIAERLSELTRFFLVDSPASPRDALEQLRIEDLSNDGTFREFKMHYRPDSSTFIHIRRDGSLDSVRDALDEIDEGFFEQCREPEAVAVQQQLATACERVSFCLKVDDVESMGFPLSVGAAAYLVQRAGGIIQSGWYSWMRPRGTGVDIVLQLET